MMLTPIRERLKAYNPRTIESPRAICAGVVIPLLEKEGEAFVLLTKRTDTVRIHKGEVSFPGGMCEEEDDGTMGTALRECCEEIGVAKKDIEIIGRLDDMYTMTGFVITPYVGIIPYPYMFRTNPGEVAYLICLPLKHLLGVNPMSERAEHGGDVRMVPSIYYKGDRIWGATCRMLLQFKQIITDEEVQP
jgi:8-oxo-dGTP pyrophosphatase MutT (NUDIX family)